jgi:4-diphosphocytidyl-2-C-methyl-D-erythritol kinase
MEIQSPAKINLFLEVTGKRPDGYHNLSTLMCCIGLYDSISLSFGGKKTTVNCSHPNVPEDETNLAFRAARLFFDNANISEGVDIVIDKKIPVGAGLGGGSSNAAAVLKALNIFYDSPLQENVLMETGKSIGADVPFFIYGKPAHATGIGDILTPYPHLAAHPILLIYPSIPVSTAQVYKKMNLRLTKNKKINTKIDFKLNWGRGASKLLYNDLETVAFEICPEIKKAKVALLQSGAMGALMSGSGSAVFGIFENLENAKQALNALSHHRMWQLYLSHLVV